MLAAVVERLTITRLGSAGDGVAEGPGGPIYVPAALPGEEVNAERDGRRVRLVAVERASPERIEPFCPYYGRCGGCATQHVGPALYESWKRGKIDAALASAGLQVRAEPLVDAHGRGRRRMTLHARSTPGRTEVGFMAAGSHDLVPIERCPITVPELAGAADAARHVAACLSDIRKPLDVAVTATAAGLDIDLRGSGPVVERRRQNLIDRAQQLDLTRLSLHGEVLIERRAPAVAMGPASLVPRPGGFLQATAAGEEALSEVVVAACAGARRAADLFAGGGPFSLRLALGADVHAVESDAASLAALDRAARGTPGLRRVTTETRDLFRRPLLPLELDRYDAVVLDPPRAGAEAQVRQLILSAVETVVMVSCDTGTFARDAAALVGGGMRLERVVAVDQFKWSAHVEMAGVFRRPKRKVRRR